MEASEKTVAIVQSSYIPWKGYFDLIALADEFILLDDVQYTARDWRNRNRIKTAAGLRWLTVPVRRPHRARIDEVEVADRQWSSHHWVSVRHNYARAPYFREYADRVHQMYAGATDPHLTTINRRCIDALCEMLGIETPIRRSTEYDTTGTKTARLLGLCRAAGATRYLSGPAAQDYLDTSLFEEHGIEVAWMRYDDYPEYPQLSPPFEHAVSVLDLLFNTGPRAQEYLKGLARPVEASR